MRESHSAILILMCISLVIAVACHLLFPRRFIAACLLAAVLATAAFRGVSYLDAGYIDPEVFWRDLVVGASLSLAGATVTGGLLRLMRRTRSA